MTARKTISFLIGLLLVLFLSTTALAADEIYGTWRLVSWKRTIVSTGETTDYFGASPNGYSMYGRDGYVFTIITHEKRPKFPDGSKMTDRDRAELYNTLIAHSGTYTFDGKNLKIKYDTSWNEVWNGTVQMRTVRFEGNRMTISTEPTVGVLDGKLRAWVMIWERVK